LRPRAATGDAARAAILPVLVAAAAADDDDELADVLFRRRGVLDIEFLVATQ
jgi:hypothetical protein